MTPLRNVVPLFASLLLAGQLPTEDRESGTTAVTAEAQANPFAHIKRIEDSKRASEDFSER
jgi:hypothetical protein